MSFTNLQQETTVHSAHLHTGFPRDIILECFSCPACQQGPEDTALSPSPFPSFQVGGVCAFRSPSKTVLLIHGKEEEILANYI